MFLVKTKPSPVIVINDDKDKDKPSFYRINQRLTRIGSDSRADLRFHESDMARHFATIEWKDDCILIHNRSGYCLNLGEISVEPNSIANWPDGQTLFLKDSLRLTLAQNPRNRSTAQSHYLNSEETKMGSGQENSKIFTPKVLGLSTLLVLVCILVIYDSSANALSTDYSTFEKLALQSYESGPEGPLKQEIISQLQMANRERFRFGNKDLKVYTQLRDYVRALENKNGQLPDRWFDEMLDYLLKRIELETKH